MVERSLYNCVLSQQFSPCGKYLICGNNNGDLAVYNLTDLLEKGENLPNKSPDFIFNTPNHEQACSMASTDQFLIIGTVGVIYGWDWPSVKQGNPRLAWKISLSNLKKKSLQDVNSMFVTLEDHVNNLLYAGCGDNLIHVHSLEDGKFIRSFEGHTDYIHSIAYFEGQMASGGEDGSVRLWDLRQMSMTGKIDPSSDPKLARPHLGKWVGDVDLHNNSLVCGGGSQPGLWDLRTLEVNTCVDFSEDCGIHVSKFLTSDSVIVGGNGPFLLKINTSGEELSRIESSSSTLYSAVFRNEPHTVLSIAGTSQNIDISTDLNTRHAVLSFFQQL